MIRLSKHSKNDAMEVSRNIKKDPLRQHSFFLFDSPNALKNEGNEISIPKELMKGAGSYSNGCFGSPLKGMEGKMIGINSRDNETQEGGCLSSQTRRVPDDAGEYDISTFDTTPPLEEIVFMTSWDHGIEVEDEELENHCKNYENATVSVHLLDETRDETMSHGNTMIRRGPSLLLFAACTYARIFGQEYLLESHSGEDSNASSTEDLFLDWYIEHGPTMRSMVPYGDSNTTETRSDSDQYEEDVSMEHFNSGRNEEECPNQCLRSMIVLGLVLVFCFACAVFYIALETIQTSKRY